MIQDVVNLLIYYDSQKLPDSFALAYNDVHTLLALHDSGEMEDAINNLSLQEYIEYLEEELKEKDEYERRGKRFYFAKW